MTTTERTAIKKLLDDPELVRRGKLLAMPIDFDSLVAAGVLKRRGHWWQILDKSRLPEHAWAKVRALRDSRKKGETLVQFERIRLRLVSDFERK